MDLENKVQQLEQELNEAKQQIVELSVHLNRLQASADKAWHLFEKVKNHPFAKAMLR